MSDMDVLLTSMNEMIASELSDIFVFCKECEKQTLELLKVATCLFDRNEIDELIEGYYQFSNNMVILENLLEQVEEPMTLLQVFAVKTMISEVKQNFDDLIDILETANLRIDDENIDFELAKLIPKLLDVVDFDVIDFDDMMAARNKMYLILDVIKQNDEKCSNLDILKIHSFSDKVSAYKYALSNGISRDQILNKHGAYFT